MPIKNKGDILTQKIVNVLKTAMTEVPGDLDDDGNVTMKEISLIPSEEESKTIYFKSPPTPLGQPVYKTETSDSGLVKIAEAISKEVLSFIVLNADVNLKERLDTLESDFNTLLGGLTTLATALTNVPLTAAIGTDLTTDIGNAGGPARKDAKTIPLKQKNETTDIG